jgi:ATP:corrinoid adenosyltransferase
VKKDDGTEEKILIEIKPFHETIEPTTDKTKTGQPTKKYLYESMTYQTNKAKWEAALKFCNANGVKFLIMDEYSLGIKRRP